MQQDTDVLNLIYNSDDKQFELLDENFNLIGGGYNLAKENVLYDVISNVVDGSIIDQSLVDENVEEIFLFLIEKIYLSHEDPIYHRMEWFQGKLNSITKRNVLIAFNKFITNNLSNIMNKEVIISYE